MKTETMAINPRFFLWIYELCSVVLLFHKNRLKAICLSYFWVPGGVPRASWWPDRSLPWFQFHLLSRAGLLVGDHWIHQDKAMHLIQHARFIIRFCRLSKKRKKKEQEEESKKATMLVGCLILKKAHFSCWVCSPLLILQTRILFPHWKNENVC